MSETIQFILIVLGCLIAAWVLTIAFLMGLLWALSGIIGRLNHREDRR